MKRKRPKPVSFKEVSTIGMTTGGEKKITKVIHEETVKEWVGIGWIDLHEASKDDYFLYPEVK